MATDTIYAPECPICGAPLSLKRVDRGSVTCTYCGASVVLGSIPELAADPERLKSIEERAQPPTLFAKYVRRYFQGPAGTLAGLSLVGAWMVFRRWPAQETAIAWCVVAAIATLFALAYKRRLYAILLSFATGGLVFLKPFLSPADSDGTFAPASDTGFGFLIPGALLMAIGIIAALRIRPARFKTDLGLLKPSLLAPLGLLVGIGLAALAYSQPTNRDLLARYAAHLDARKQQYAAIAAWIDAPGRPALAVSAPGLNPPPVFVEDSPASNVDFTPVEWMYLRPYGTPAKILHIGSALSQAFDRRREIDDEDDWDRDDRLGDLILPLATATRYVVAYRCQEGTDDYPIFGCTAWMFALDTSAPLLQVELTDTYRSFTEAADALFAALAAATGGTFRPITI
jgi:hypothetical protein